MVNYDAIIIGTGQGGPALARRLVAAGWKVAIIERKLFGGTCVNTGCTPTKALIASAYAAHVARCAADWGVKVEGAVNVDMKAVKARKDAVVASSRNGVERSLKTLEGCTVYEGHGHFIAEKRVAVNGSELAADRIFINVGGRAAIPPIPGLDRVPYLTNSSMMDVDFLPSHLIILGGSYVDLEFAQMYRRFGSEVTVLELGSNVIPREDRDVSQAVAAFLKEEGIDVRVDSKVVGVDKERNSIAVKVESAGKISQVVGTHVLVAIGRQPNTDDLGLDQAGIASDGRGYIQVDDQLRTNVPGIWAMGDCNGRGAFTHTGRPALISTKAMEDVSRAYEKGETKGFMKILVDQDSKQILGASFLGLAGDEVVHCILDLMYAKAPCTVLQRAMHIHPTVSEFLPTMMGDLVPLQ